MKLEKIIKLAKKHNGKRSCFKTNWFGFPIVEEVIYFEFAEQENKTAFLKQLPKENYRADGPCDDSDKPWCYVKSDDCTGIAHWDLNNNLAIDKKPSGL